MYGSIIMGLELLLFGAISRNLTEFENYRTQSEFESAYIFKMFFFVWVEIEPRWSRDTSSKCSSSGCRPPLALIHK